MTIIFLVIVIGWCSYFNANVKSSGKYANNKYHFSIEYPMNYQIYYLPNNLGVYFKPIGRPVWEQTVISVLVLPHSRYLPPMSDYDDVISIVKRGIVEERIVQAPDIGKLIESVIDRGEYTIQIIYNSPDKPLGLEVYDDIVSSLKVW